MQSPSPGRSAGDARGRARARFLARPARSSGPLRICTRRFARSPLDSRAHDVLPPVAGGVFKNAALKVLRTERKLMSTGDVTRYASRARSRFYRPYRAREWSWGDIRGSSASSPFASALDARPRSRVPARSTFVRVATCNAPSVCSSERRTRVSAPRRARADRATRDPRKHPSNTPPTHPRVRGASPTVARAPDPASPAPRRFQPRKPFYTSQPRCFSMMTNMFIPSIPAYRDDPRKRYFSALSFATTGVESACRVCV